MNIRSRRRLSRRLRHRSRSVAVSIALVVAILAALWLGTESVLAALRLPALLLSPTSLVTAAVGASPLAVVAAAVIGVLGLIALLLAVTPGRQARHEVPDERVVVILDDDVLASAISREVATAARVDDDQVRTSVSRRRVVSRVRPTTGYPPEVEPAATASRAVVEVLGVRPVPRARVVVEQKGVLA